MGTNKNKFMEEKMKKVVTSLLLVFALFFLFTTNVLSVDAQEKCDECTLEVKCEKHSDDNKENQDSPDSINSNERKGGLIVRDENDEGETACGIDYDEKSNY